MSVWFTSDLHLGHFLCTKQRGFSNIDEHNHHIIEKINELVNKRDKLFILGDLAFSDSGMKCAKEIRCQNVELILGNHDKYPIWKYLELGWKIHGFRGYRNFWLSHCPVHQQEIMGRKIGNIHGHIHSFGSTDTIGIKNGYFCVNPEYNNLKPYKMEEIERAFIGTTDTGGSTPR